MRTISNISILFVLLFLSGCNEDKKEASVSSIPAPAPEEFFSVEFYEKNIDVRKAKLIECNKDSALSLTSNCMNAQKASNLARVKNQSTLNLDI